MAASVAAWAVLAHCGDPSGQGPDPEAPPPDVYNNDIPRNDGYVPNPDFVPAPSPRIDTRRQALSTEGEVVVIEGDSRFVTAGMGGGFGVTSRNQTAIVQEVLSTYPDRFDTIAIFLSFTDQAHVGTAFYQNISNGVQGIGRNVFNGRGGWGLPELGRLSGFVNMNNVEQFGGLRGSGSTFSSYHAVLAQELTHRWLMFFQFTDGTGMMNDSLLGRQDAHWSPLVHAYGSVQDGIDWRDNKDGTFTALGSENGFAPMDLYGMGIYGPSQVEPFYYIADAKLNGMDLDRMSRISGGNTVTGSRIDVTVDQVISAMGPRNPPKGTETPYYRAAFVLITEPGQSRTVWQPYLDAVQAAADTFPETYKVWSLASGAICTKVTAPCPEPDLELQDFTIADGNDNLVGPGDSFQLSLRIRNDGIGTAEDVKVTVESLVPEIAVVSSTVTVAAVPQNGIADVSTPFSVTLGPSLECGQIVKLQVKLTSKEGPSFRSRLEMVIGNRTVRIDPLHEAPDWTVDPDGTDTVSAGEWDLGEPEFVSVLGVVTQPAEDHTPGDGKLSFHTGPTRGANFSAHDVDGGRTTLQSPPFALADTTYPSLVFYAWHIAINFANVAGPTPVSGADLVVQASNDGGKNYVEVLRISENTSAWQRYSVPLAPHLVPTNKVRFRFVIEDLTESGTVEAGIDDVEVIDLLAQCPVPALPGEPTMPDPAAKMIDKEEGCRCVSSRTDRFGVVFLLVALGLLFVRRRRNHER